MGTGQVHAINGWIIKLNSIHIAPDAINGAIIGINALLIARCAILGTDNGLILGQKLKMGPDIQDVRYGAATGQNIKKPT